MLGLARHRLRAGFNISRTDTEVGVVRDVSISPMLRGYECFVTPRSGSRLKATVVLVCRIGRGCRLPRVVVYRYIEVCVILGSWLAMVVQGS